MGLWLSRAIAVSIPAIAERRVDRLQFLEVELDNCLQLVRQPRLLKALRQVVQPDAVFPVADRSARPPLPPTVLAGTGCVRSVSRALLAQRSAAPSLALGRVHGSGTAA